MQRTRILSAASRGTLLPALVALVGTSDCGARSGLTLDSLFAAGSAGASTSSSGGAGPAGGGVGGVSANAGQVNALGSSGTAGTSAGAAGVTGAAGADCGLLIDDMESDTGHICTGDGRKGVWYAFNDSSVGASQWPAPTPPGTPIALSPSDRSGSAFAVHTFGSGFFGWGAGVGLDFSFDGAVYRRFDGGAYDGVQFWAKSKDPDSLSVRVSTPDTTEIAYGGSCKAEPCPKPLMVDVKLSPDWTQYQVSFNELDAESNDWHLLQRTQLLNLQFMGALPNAAFDFWIDDVSFYRADHDCCSSRSAQCQGVLGFADQNLQAAVRASLFKPVGDITCEDTCSHLRLDAGSMKIASLAGLQCLPELTRVDLSNNQLTDLSPLSTLPQLTWLDLSSNQLQTATGLATLPQLTTLFLDHDPIVDATPLGALNALTSLSLEYSAISDLSQFLPLSQVHQLGVVGDPIDCAAQASTIATLRSRLALLAIDCP